MTGSLLLITACGGGSAGNSASNETPTPAPTPAPTTVEGKVFDGYIVGATVWLDINGNKQLDDNEPSAVSESLGDYSLELTDEERECLIYATLFVDVPVGAIDEDLGAVTEAYQMSTPPLLEPIGDDDLLNISPLTTTLWQQIEERIIDDNQEQGCQALRQNHTLRNELAREISSVIRNLVFHYNISAEDIYADYIGSSNEEASQAAQSIVTGLKAAYRHKAGLEGANPDAFEIRVLVYEEPDQDNASLPGTWLRSSVTFSPDSHSIEEVVLNSDDLNIVERATFTRDERSTDWNGGRLTISQDISPLEGGADDEYRCSSGERVRFTEDATIYTLANNYAGTQGSEAVCGNNSNEFGDADGSSKSYSVRYREPGEPDVLYLADFSINQNNSEFDALGHWQALEDNADVLNPTELIDRLEQLPYRFEQVVTVEGSWFKRATDDSGANRISTRKFGDGESGDVEWERSTFQSDNTRIEECSTDGTIWTECDDTLP